ncbi:class II glutamine amidotransferase [Aestuariicella hydrocarbonica]|uniref:Class II glutamine amidotransferase n=1 Tax=Pseudomaricurvus hydrocarbonicus TaxID=1470433 RepID=A0A9E5MGI9_9GAMM|nr:class II glutamine amidotransferase [Aestuariicella hydrocarbonica]NHO64731.1 class II glutamine amidotransferase [Aestuariicella hydrocarbonica]
MCELLGMSANVPTDICFSFQGLIQRGGGTGPHKDGWGIVFYEGKGIREFRDPDPGVDSEVARLVQRYPIKSCYVISHIRQANMGPICLENTHPFTREVWGENWTFAHNGQLPHFDSLTLGKDVPIGTTDSEHAFCWLLQELRTTFDRSPDPQTLKAFLHPRCEQLRAMGVFNLLLSNGRFLLAYCSTKLQWITRRAPFGKAQLTDADVAIDFAGETTPNDVVTVVATEPLTNNERWHKMLPGEMVLFVDGEFWAGSGGK